MTTPPEILLLEVLERPPEALSRAAIEWLAGGVRDHLQTGEALQSALGVRRYAVLRARRDQHLRRAWAALDGLPWPRSEELARRIRDFESRRWPRVQYQAVPPGRFDAVDRELFGAFRLSVKVPASGRALHGICASEPPKNAGM